MLRVFDVMTKYLDDITHVLARHELRYYTYCRWFYESFRKTRGLYFVHLVLPYVNEMIMDPVDVA